MAAPVQDAIVLLGDSITQYGWEAGCFAQRLSRKFFFFAPTMYDYLAHVRLGSLILVISLSYI